VSTAPRLNRQKISTTISSSALSYFEQLIDQGEARNLAEAIDLVVQRLGLYENRERLANDTAAYFDQLPAPAAQEESALGAALSRSGQGIDFDREL